MEYSLYICRMEKLTIIARNYYWECGDGCCSEGRQQYELKVGNNKFHFETLYETPCYTKEEFIREIDYKGNIGTMAEAILEEFEEVESLLTPFELNSLSSILKHIDFDFIYTDNQYDDI